MKKELRVKAREMRTQGESLKHIRKVLGVSVSSVSLWTRDIILTPEQIAKLTNKERVKELSAITMRENRDKRWATYIKEAELEWPELSQDPSFMFGLALYIGEGSKTDMHCGNITNCDYRVIRKAIRFFERLGVVRDKLRVGLYLHVGDDKNLALKHWMNMIEMPDTSFSEIVIASPKSSHQKKGKLHPYGTCRVSFYNTRVRQKLEFWMGQVLSTSG